jgi:hypothetical protein
MLYKGNFSNIFEPEALQFILANQGDLRPQTNIDSYQLDNFGKWKSAGYDMSKIRWEVFSGDTPKFNFKISLPFKGTIKWWFAKLHPGDMFPLHLDTFPNNINVRRYWIACQDYIPGHIFAYDDKILTGYKAGDVFMFDHSTVLHGSANIGFTPKISLQVAVTDDQ